VSRPWRVLTVLLGAQAGISAVAAALDWTWSCGACRAGGFSLGPVGFAFYAGLFVAALAAGPNRLLFSAVLFAFGIHVMLTAQLLWLGLHCWVCFAAAANATAMAALAVACDRANLGRLAAALPWAVLLVVGWAAIPRSEPAPAAVRVTAFTQPDCPYCDDWRDRMLPELRREFGPRLQAAERPAAEMPALRRTPTLVIAPARRDARTQVIEGLPDYATIRGAVLRAEGKP
jgi:hypothetical protein